MNLRNREFGSDFNLILTSNPVNNFLKNIELFFSGRAALCSLLKWGVQIHKWEKVFFPSYYCHEVIDFLQSLEIKVGYYNFNPFSTPSLSAELDHLDVVGNVVINVDYFGIKTSIDRKFDKAVVVDDLTHNLGAIGESRADYCFGSLRKVLPVPCGGFLFSRTNETIIQLELENDFAEDVSIQKLTAMYLKTQYLNGKDVDKKLYRNLFIEAEEKFSDIRTSSRLPISALSVLRYVQIEPILNRKKRNLEVALRKLNMIEGVEYNLSSNVDSAFGLILRFSQNSQRDELRSYLIRHKIFPAVLWPNQVRPEDIEVTNSILFLHIDFRYNDDDIVYLVEALNTFFQK